MIARPALAALSCRQCQTAIFRAVLSNSGPSLRALPHRQVRQLPILTKRLFSSGKPIETSSGKEATETSAAAASPEEVPWFLEVEPPRHSPSQHVTSLPKVPEDAPEVLGPMIRYIYKDMGLDDISLLDLRDLDPPAALGPNLIMIFGTARSERHLHISSGRFQRWLKRNHNINARADGLIGPGELRTKLRRLRKKAKLMGTNTAIIPGGDNGISTGWVCVNFSPDTGNSDEAETFDESGRFSGFGAPLTGTTVVVQCMTEARRQELDLESLWQGILKRSLQTNKKIRGEKVDETDVEALLASRVQLPTSSSALQWQAMSKASQQQQRHYSTSARRLTPTNETITFKNYLRTTGIPKTSDVASGQPRLMLDQVRKHFQDIQLIGIPFTINVMYNLIKAVFHAEAEGQSSAAERLALVDQLLLTAEERGMTIWSAETFIVLVENIAISPSYGPELERAQKNIEYLMTQEGSRPSDEQILRLMSAYAQQANWAMFWDAFRMPPRFNTNRIVEQYDLAYRVMTATGNAKMCTAALRHVYYEMVNQDPPINPVDSIYESLKACILVADPEADHLLRNPPSMLGLAPWQRARLANREFFKLLREVEEKRVTILFNRGHSERDYEMEAALNRLESQRAAQESTMSRAMGRRRSRRTAKPKQDCIREDLEQNAEMTDLVMDDMMANRRTDL